MDHSWLISTIVSSLLSVMCAMLNHFFIFCLWYRQGHQQLQRSLKHLLTWCVVSNIFCNTATISVIYTQIYTSSVVGSLVISAVYYFFACNSLVTPSWLSIFYYFSIVPQTFCTMVWAKRNVHLVVFCFLLMDWLLISISTALMTVSNVAQQSEVDLELLNLTNSTNCEPSKSSSLVLYIIHLQLSFWTLAFTWGGTFIYLRRHMMAMQNTGSSSLQTYQSQMRITIIGLVQAGCYLPCCLWVTVDAFVNKMILLHYGLISVCSVVALINSVCLGLMQSVFRQQVLLMSKTVWNKLRCV